MPTPFCQTCFDRMVSDFRSKHAEGSNAYMSRESMNYACKIPLYESDHQGRPIVKVFDCKAQIYRRYPQQEWERMKRDEEV